MITDKSRRYIFARLGDIAEMTQDTDKPRSRDYMHGWVHGTYQIRSINDITKEQFEDLKERLTKMENILLNKLGGGKNG